MKRVISVVIFLCILLCAGCSNSAEKNLVGTWSDHSGREFVFYEDGTYLYGKGYAGEVNGDYKLLSDTEIEFTSNSQGLGADPWNVAGVQEFELNGDTLIIKTGGVADTYTKTK